MSTLSKLLTACGLALAAFVFTAPAQAAAPKKPAKPAHVTTEAETPGPAGSVQTDYACELGNKISIFRAAADEDRIFLRWQKKVHELSRVLTTTGAIRFESAAAGLVWIGIPSKGILLDSKAGRQLANECQSPEQKKASATKLANEAKTS